MSGILARVRIKHKEGADIACLYQKEDLNQLGLMPTKFAPNETFLNVGDEFSLGDDNYRVVDINTKIFNQTYEPTNYGVNLSGGKQEPYNFQITCVVENV
jgi:hypothetical protein